MAEHEYLPETEALIKQALTERNTELENLYDTCREDWRFLMRVIDTMAEKGATGSRDFGRGYALALRDVKREMARLDNLTLPKSWTLADEVALGLHEEPHP